MDVEKTMEFVRTSQAAHAAAMAALTEKLRGIGGKLDSLAISTAKLPERADAGIERLDALVKRSESEGRQWMERDTALDARIDRLVSAFGEYIRNQPANE